MVTFTHRIETVGDMDVRNEEWIPGSNHDPLKLLVCECKQVIGDQGVIASCRCRVGEIVQRSLWARDVKVEGRVRLSCMREKFTFRGHTTTFFFWWILQTVVGRVGCVFESFSGE